MKREVTFAETSSPPAHRTTPVQSSTSSQARIALVSRGPGVVIAVPEAGRAETAATGPVARLADGPPEHIG